MGHTRRVKLQDGSGNKHDYKEREETQQKRSSKGLNEKKELVAAPMVKTSKPEDEVLKAYDEFYFKHEDGFISKEEYTNSTKVSAAFLQFVMSSLPGIHQS